MQTSESFFDSGTFATDPAAQEAVIQLSSRSTRVREKILGKIFMSVVEKNLLNKINSYRKNEFLLLNKKAGYSAHNWT